LHVELAANVVSDDYTCTDCFRKAVGLKSVYMHMHYVSLMICTAHPVWFGWLNPEEWDGLGM